MSSYGPYYTSSDVNVEAGIVPLGPSKNNPIPTATVQNYNSRSWFTLENYLALPVLVSSVQQGSVAPNTASGFTIPPLTRTTIPADPTQDLLLSCLGKGQFYDMKQWDGANIFSDVPQGTFYQRNLQYMLHDNGAMFQTPLMPNPLQLGGQFDNLAGNLSRLYYITPSGLQVPGLNVQWLWTGNLGKAPTIDAVLLYATFQLGGPNVSTFDPSNLRIRPCYDYDTVAQRHTSFTAGIAPFTGTGLGTSGQRVVLRCPGAIGFAIQNFDNASVFYDVEAFGMLPAQ